MIDLYKTQMLTSIEKTAPHAGYLMVSFILIRHYKCPILDMSIP
jgi:hypothetical protein